MVISIAFRYNEIHYSFATAFMTNSLGAMSVDPSAFLADSIAEEYDPYESEVSSDSSENKYSRQVWLCGWSSNY